MNLKEFCILNCLASLAMTLIVFFCMSACDVHADIDIQTPDIESVIGDYSGNYGFGNETPENPILYKIKAGGVFQEIGLHAGSVVGQGTWEMTGDIITAQYTTTFAPFNKYSIRATFDIHSGSLKGTWGGEHNASDGGKIVLYQN